MTGYKKDGSLAFNSTTFGDVSGKSVSSLRLEKQTIKMIEKHGSMAPANSITKFYIEDGKPLCIKNLIGIVGFKNVYVF